MEAPEPEKPPTLSLRDVIAAEADITFEAITTALAPLTDLEALSQCRDLFINREIGNSRTARLLLDAAEPRDHGVLSSLEGLVKAAVAAADPVDWRLVPVETWTQALEKISAGQPDARSVIEALAQLHQVRTRLDSFDSLFPSPQGPSSSRSVADDRAPLERGAAVDPAVEVVRAVEAVDGELDGIEEEAVELDDPWAETSEEAEDVPLDDPWDDAVSDTASDAGLAPDPTTIPDSPAEDGEPILLDEESLSLAEFLVTSVVDTALGLACGGQIAAFKILWTRHHDVLWPFRVALLDAFPAWTNPRDLHDAGLLPVLDRDGNEVPFTPSSPRSFLDALLIFLYPVQSLSSLPTNDASLSLATHDTPQSLPSLAPNDKPRLAEDIAAWYESRIASLDTFGLVDLQLAWVQQGASQGITSLDILGEDLSLLSKLVYDANLSPVQQAEWTLSTWRTAPEAKIVHAYLSNSTADTVVRDIRRLVLPYLHVLESRAERAGRPDAKLVERYLHDSILSLPLHLALPVFEQSKATLASSERIVRNDQDVARLALACLYGSDARDVWATMSAIFECLPVWDVSGGDLESDKEATASTLDAIATFVRPTKAGIAPPTSKDLFIFFHPLPFASLSRALDILDVHLESGEILARWDVAVQLRFLLQSARDGSEQLELAEKMCRRQAGRGLDERRWEALWADMKKLNGGADALLRGAFGMLSYEDMMRVYLGGVLASGRFDIARKMIRKLEIDHGLPFQLVEGVVLACSREFYENAESGNIHTGDMKLAYDCLTVARPSPAIASERSFIEATSRLTTYNLASPSNPSSSLSPLEIRHTPNKLELVRLVLSTSDDAYRHSEIVLELSEKLGNKNATARGEVLGMLADSAMRHGDFERAYEHVQAMVALAKARTAKSTPTSTPTSTASATAHEAPTVPGDSPRARLRDACWRLCAELGGQPEYSSTPQKMLLLGQAVEICPAEKIPAILGKWRAVERGQMKLAEAAKRRRLAGDLGSQSTLPRTRQNGRGGVGGGHGSGSGGGVSNPSPPSRSSSLRLGRSGTGDDRVLGSRTAARAAKIALDLGDRLHLRGFGTSPTLPSGAFSALSLSRSSSRSRDPGDAAAGLGLGPGYGGHGHGHGTVQSGGDWRGGERDWRAGERDWRAGERGVGAGSRGGMGEGIEVGDGDRGGERDFAEMFDTGDGERVRQGARRALVKGVGWLLGADENEISG